jgi:hypothetical protein
MSEGFPHGHLPNAGAGEDAKKEIQVIRDHCPNGCEGIINSLSKWLDELFIRRGKTILQIESVKVSIRKDLNEIRENVREAIGALDKAKE